MAAVSSKAVLKENLNLGNVEKIVTTGEKRKENHDTKVGKKDESRVMKSEEKQSHKKQKTSQDRNDKSAQSSNDGFVYIIAYRIIHSLSGVR